MSTSTPAPTHEPPSLPASPLPKRTKVIDPTPLTNQQSFPHASADDSGTATPTPLMSFHAPTHIAPSVAAAAGAEQALQVQLLSDKARAPTKGSAYAAGHDLYSARDVVVPKWGRCRVDTDISIAVPVGTCEYSRVGSGGLESAIADMMMCRWTCSPPLRPRCQARHRHHGGRHRCGLPWPSRRYTGQSVGYRL